MAMKHHESSRKMQFFSQKLDIRAFERFACGLLRIKLRPAKNKTAAPPSEKQNAVLTLARDANYKSCRTQNSSRTEFDVVAVDCSDSFLCEIKSMTYFEEARRMTIAKMNLLCTIGSEESGGGGASSKSGSRVNLRGVL